MPITKLMRAVSIAAVCLACIAGCRSDAPVETRTAPPGAAALSPSSREVTLLPPGPRVLPGALPPIETAFQLGPEPPSTSAPYRLKAGDVIEINILGEDDALKQVVVGPDGRISYLSVADLQVSGKTFEEVRREITERLARDFIDPHVTVTGAKYSGNTITVMGVVGKPGQYEVREGMRLLDALAAAGGIQSAIYTGAGTNDVRAVADLRRAVLLRGKAVVPVDFEALLDGTPDDMLANNVAVRAGDTIYIPSGLSIENKVFVLGMVNIPSVVRFTGSISFVEAVAEAGGIPVGAWERKAYVVRGRLSSPTLLPVNVRSVLTGAAPDVALMPGDIVFIPRTPLKKLDEIASQIIPMLSAVDSSLNIRDRVR
jgi:polysaccharide export outer membrane protein